MTTRIVSPDGSNDTKWAGRTKINSKDNVDIIIKDERKDIKLRTTVLLSGVKAPPVGLSSIAA